MSQVWGPQVCGCGGTLQHAGAPRSPFAGFRHCQVGEDADVAPDCTLPDRATPKGWRSSTILPAKTVSDVLLCPLHSRRPRRCQNPPPRPPALRSVAAASANRTDLPGSRDGFFCRLRFCSTSLAVGPLSDGTYDL